jgi:hypothetical protein
MCASLAGAQLRINDRMLTIDRRRQDRPRERAKKNWTSLNQNIEMNRTAQTQTTIHFPIKAAVEFVARGASICGLDAAVQAWRR